MSTSPAQKSDPGPQRWVVFPLAWTPERAARMTASAEKVRRWLIREGVTGVGMESPERRAARQRSMQGPKGERLTAQESWLAHDVLVADARRLIGPGERVLERASRVLGAAAGAVGGSQRRSGPQGGTGSQIGGSEASTGPATGSVGLLEVERYALVEHDWSVEDASVIVEDVPWSQVDDREGMRAWPVTWWGIAVDPKPLGVDGDDWQDRAWRLGWERPAWAGQTGLRAMAVLQPFGWKGAPLRSDLDEVEPFLPRTRTARGVWEHMAWLAPAGGSGSGWTVAWRVRGSR